MSASTVSFNSKEVRKKDPNQKTLIKSTKSNYESKDFNSKSNISSSDDDSFISSKVKSSNSHITRNKDFNNVKKPINDNNNFNINSKSLKKTKSNTQLLEKRNNENSNNQSYSDSDYSDIPIHYTNNKISNRPKGTHPIKNSVTRKIASGNIKRGKKSSISLVLSSSESSSESLRVKKSIITYRTINYKSDESDSDVKYHKRQNTLDTVIESDSSDDIPFLESVQESSEINFKSNRNAYLKDESTENFENETEKVSEIESQQKSSLTKSSSDSNELKSEDEIPHQKEKSDNEDNIPSSTSTDNLNPEQKQNSKSRKNNHNNGIVRTKHYSKGKYKIPKKKRKSHSKIQINISDSEEEKEQEIESKNDNKIQKEHQNQNESSHSNSQNENENKNISDESILNTNNENNEDLQEDEFEKGVRNEKEIKRLCSLFMKRLPGYKIPNDLIPYKMFTDTKISFHGKKAKFTLFRGETPLLVAKLKNKSGSDPIVNIFKYTQPASSTKKEKKKDKAKIKKSLPIAIIITGSNMSTFSLRKSEVKSEIKSEVESEVDQKNDTEKDEFSSIHNLFGPGFGKELMTVIYSAPKVDYAPRIVNLSFNDPPHPIPKELTNRKPKFTYGSTCILDIGGRVAKRSIKNCIMVDENNKDRMSIMKIHDSEVSIEAYPAINELCVFAFGISSVLCKI